MKDFKNTVDLENLAAIVVDEISTVSATPLGSLSQRFQEATGNFDLPFGGIPAILVGDFSQLPPVQASG